jgi:hypothetical protein
MAKDKSETRILSFAKHSRSGLGEHGFARKEGQNASLFHLYNWIPDRVSRRLL